MGCEPIGYQVACPPDHASRDEPPRRLMQEGVRADDGMVARQPLFAESEQQSGVG
jgi:hypothetical protein